MLEGIACVIANRVFDYKNGEAIASLSFRGGFNVAGQPEVNNNYLLDGIDNSDSATMQPTVSPSIDGIQEFKVLTGVYNAEYGRFSGGQILITTKSGGNQFHGSAYEFFRTSALDAKNYFSPGSLPSFRRNQYGATVGGPVIRNRAFFFGTYEGLRLTQQISALATVPTLQDRTGEAALPIAMERMEQMGIPEKIVGFVIPTGYSFNLAGSCLYLSLAAVFMAQAGGIHLSLTSQVIMIGTMMLTSKGIAGIPRAVFVVLTATAASFHLPLTILPVLLGVDALMDMGRATVNVVGNCLAAAVIARWEGSSNPVPLND